MKKITTLISFICLMMLILAGCGRQQIMTMEQDMNHYSYLYFDFATKSIDRPTPYYANPSDPMFGHCEGIFYEFNTYYTIDGDNCYYRIQKSVIEEFPELKECRVGYPCVFTAVYAGVYKRK